jgi:VCBS repeat-containing protein
VTINANGSYTYTPQLGFSGSDSFSFTAHTADDSTSGSVTVTVNDVNDLTVVSPSISVNENGSASGNVLTGAVDSEGAPITATAGTFATAHGSVTITNNGSYTYTPSAGYVGSDSFTFTAQTADDSTIGTVGVTVNAVDDLTLGPAQTLVINENTSGSGNVLTGAIDSENATITAIAGTWATAHGSVSITGNGAFTYTPSAGYFGSDSFGFTAQTADDSTTGTVSVTVNAVDDLTLGPAQILVINENTSGSGNVLTGAVDSENATITATAGTFTTPHGSVTINANGSYTYTPQLGFAGSDSFSFTAHTADDSTSGSVTVTVNHVNDLTVSNGVLTVNENGSAVGNVVSGAVDSEGAPISAVAGTFATGHGSVTIANNGSYTYTPTPGYAGNDSFNFTDQTADDSTTGSVTVTVNAVDDLTVVTPQSLNVVMNASGSGNVLTGAVDSEGAAISATAGTFATAHGSVTISGNGAYTYTPTAGFVGADSFSFTAKTADDSTSGIVNVSVKEQSTTTLKSSTNPTVSGQTITLTATVTGSPGHPTGSITFLDGSNVLGSATLNSSGVATLGVSLMAGSHALTASYAGDATFAGSTSAALTQTVNQAKTQVAITSSANPSVYGQAVTFTATVTVSSPGSGTPTGTMTFYDGGAVLGTGTVGSGGVATFTISTLSVNSHAITAKYNGDVNFSNSTSSSLNQQVKKASTAVTAGPTSAIVNQPVTLTATVSVLSPGSGTPTGTVTFKDTTTNTVLGTVTLQNGVATLSGVIFHTTGQHNISVTYNGDNNDLTSSITFVLTVGT